MIRTLVAIMLVGCGSSSQSGDGGSTGGCRDERDCSGATPYCEPSTGSCVECRWSTHCTGATLVCEAQHCRAARTCAELAAELPGLPSGLYDVDLDGDGAPDPQKTWCEMTADGGGWTLVQRTRWSWAQSQALYTGFAAWADMTLGNPLPGNAYRLAGARWPDVNAGKQMMVVHHVRTTNGGVCNPLYYTASATFSVDAANAQVTIAGLQQVAPLVADPSLSTTDSGPSKDACVVAGSAVPWFYSACCSTCVTYKGGYWNDEPHPMQSYTQSTADIFGHTEANVCGAQTVREADSGPPFRGDDSMEVYLR